MSAVSVHCHDCHIYHSMRTSTLRLRRRRSNQEKIRCDELQPVFLPKLHPVPAAALLQRGPVLGCTFGYGERVRGGLLEEEEGLGGGSVGVWCVYENTSGRPRTVSMQSATRTRARWPVWRRGRLHLEGGEIIRRGRGVSRCFQPCDLVGHKSTSHFPRRCEHPTPPEQRVTFKERSLHSPPSA